MRCEGCGSRERVHVLHWPRSGLTKVLCATCASPLCELCGHEPAAWSCGTGSGNYHVGDGCLDADEVRRKKARPLRRRP